MRRRDRQPTPRGGTGAVAERITNVLEKAQKQLDKAIQNIASVETWAGFYEQPLKITAHAIKLDVLRGRDALEKLIDERRRLEVDDADAEL